ncbi:hypothetical protein [Marinobacterium litorale]|uniref:hypothetical protein n=1 Tax=Marinobacterium litorale TaxID=404770 RepID=UPI00040B93A8|nr:hypothetical protein [Marinobacterium litorale]
MTPTETGMLILGGVAVLAITAYIVQSIESQRRARRMRLLALKDQIRRADHLLASLPSFYVTPDMRNLLIRYMEKRWRLVMELDANPVHGRELERLNGIAAQPFDPGQYPQGSLTHSDTRDNARRNRALIRELAQFITDLQKQNQVNKNTAQEMIRHLKQSYTRLTIELELMDAQQTEEVAGPQVALHSYKSALTRLQGFNNAYQIDAQIFALTRKIEQCEKIAEEIRQQQEAEQKARDQAEREREQRERYR